MRKPKLLTALALGFGSLLIAATVFTAATIFERQQVLYGKVDRIFQHLQTEPQSREQQEKFEKKLHEVHHLRATQNTLILSLGTGFVLVLLIAFQAIMMIVAKRLAEMDRTRVQLAVTQALAESQDFRSGALRVLSAMGELYNFAFGAVWLVDEQHGWIKPHTIWVSRDARDQTFNQATLSSVFKKGIGLPGRVWQAESPCWITDVVVDKNYPRAKAALRSGLHAALGFPILKDDKVIGVVEFYFPKILPRQRDLLDLLSSFGHALAAFIERMDFRTRLTEEARIATFAALVGQVVSSATDLDEMLTECANLTVQHLGTKFAGVWIPTGNQNIFELRGQYGDTASLPGMSRLEIDQTSIERLTAAETKFARNGNLLLRLAYKQANRKPEFAPLLITPLLVGTKLVGLIGVQQKTKLSDRSTATLSIACKNVALGIVRCQMKEELQASDRLFTEITNNLEEMIWVTQPGGYGIKWVSRALAKFFHCTPEEMLEDPLKPIKGIHESDREAAYSFFQNSAVGPSSVEYRQLCADDKWHWLWCRSYPSFDESGKLAEVYGIAIDITEKKEEEKHIQEFYSMVSHELRTPLTSVHASLRIMEGGLVGPLSEKVQHIVTIARQESDRLIRLINDILDIRKIDADMLELKLREIDVAYIVEQSVSEMKGMADSAGVALISHLNWQGVFTADQDRTMQMLENLLSNAIKFSPSGAAVEVTVDRREDRLRFTVSDKGAGIASDKQHKLFCKFQQLDSSDSRPKGGSGLGLVITKAIAEQHGGSVGFDSEPGRGSNFWIELPLTAKVQTRRLMQTQQSPGV